MDEGGALLSGTLQVRFAKDGKRDVTLETFKGRLVLTDEQAKTLAKVLQAKYGDAK